MRIREAAGGLEGGVKGRCEGGGGAGQRKGRSRRILELVSDVVINRQSWTRPHGGPVTDAVFLPGLAALPRPCLPPRGAVGERSSLSPRSSLGADPVVRAMKGIRITYIYSRHGSAAALEERGGQNRAAHVTVL